MIKLCGRSVSIDLKNKNKTFAIIGIVSLVLVGVISIYTILYIAKQAGFNPEKIYFHGNNKQTWLTLRGLLYLNADGVQGDWGYSQYEHSR